MPDLDKKIKKLLHIHDKLVERAEDKRIGEDEFSAKKHFLSRKIDPLLDERIRRLEGEKEKLVFGLHDLEGGLEEGQIGSDDYSEQHLQNQERLAEIDAELTALHGGKRDLGTLTTASEPKVVIKRAHMIVLLSATFLFVIFFMSFVLGVEFNFASSFINFLKAPFEQPDGKKLLSGAKGFAAGIMGGKENIIGFGMVKPLPGTRINGGEVETRFMKPRLNVRLMEAKAFNAETEEGCSGDVYVNMRNLSEYGVGITPGDDSFHVRFTDCPVMRSANSDLKRVGMRLVFESSIGDSSTQHIVNGEIDLF